MNLFTGLFPSSKGFSLAQVNLQRLRIWFDILTPKQVMFFKDAVKVLREKGHEVLCTSRDYREAVELAKMKGLDLKLVGRHGGSERYSKLVASAERIEALAGTIDEFAPDTAVTFSSPEGARVAFGLGIRHIGFNDSPHAEAVARLTIPLMNKLLCPWVIPYASWVNLGISRRNIMRYHALDPAAWLKDSEADFSATAKGEASEKERTILIRLEETKASYIADKKLGSTDLVGTVINEFAQYTNVSILCRYNDQIEEAKQRYGGKAKIIENVIDGIALLKSIDLFIGAGGTMTAEAALLGIPTISIAPVRYYIEEYLVQSGLVARARKANVLPKLVNKMLSDDKFRKMQKKRAARVLASMEDPTEKILEATTQQDDHHKL